MYQNSSPPVCTSCQARSLCSFENLPVELLEQLTDSKRTYTFSRGETIFQFGDEATHFYCVRSGRLQVYRSSPCREQSFQIAGPGDWVGHRDSLGGGTYRQGVRCLTEATVCKINRRVLETCMQAYPDFARSLVENLARGWIESEHQSYNLGSRKIMERLADYLLNLKARISDNRGEGEAVNGTPTEVEFLMTREMLATLLGTTTESVIRTLSDFKARGWIDLSRGKVVLINEKELARLVAES